MLGSISPGARVTLIANCVTSCFCGMLNVKILDLIKKVQNSVKKVQKGAKKVQRYIFNAETFEMYLCTSKIDFKKRR